MENEKKNQKKRKLRNEIKKKKKAKIKEFNLTKIIKNFNIKKI